MNTTSYLKRRSKPSSTPPMPRSSSSFDESYFSKTYVPLSSLPTPPLSHSRNNSRQQSPDSFSPDEILDPDLLGPAIHLTNLIPSSTSLTEPSIPLVHSVLTRCNLPLETLALAVCILDSLNTRFALQWRTSFPLQLLSLPPPFTSLPSNGRLEYQHIDNVHPEIIVLSALILAQKFLDDQQTATREYVESWGRGVWSCEQVNFTQRIILDNLGYRLLPLWDEKIILEALEDMERASQSYEPEIYDEDEEAEAWIRKQERFEMEMVENLPLTRMGTGKAVMGVGNQITPVETPVCEGCKGTKILSGQTRDAFCSSEESFGELRLSAEPFPAFVAGYGF